MKECGTAVFRADASVEIGTGHVMRCLTLADRLRSRGLRCRFVSRDRRGALTAYVRSRGHGVELLPPGSAARSDSPAHEPTLLLDIDLIPGSDEMARLIAESDFAIGAAGSTSWERSALGLPAVVLVLANNQRGISQALQAADAATSVDLRDLGSALRHLFADPELTSRLARMSATAATLADGAGVQRVADCLRAREVS